MGLPTGSLPTCLFRLQCGAGPFVIPRASIVWTLLSPQSSPLWTEVWVLQWARPVPSSPGCVCGQNASKEDEGPKEEVAFSERQRDMSRKWNRVMRSLLSGLRLHVMFLRSRSLHVSAPVPLHAKQHPVVWVEHVLGTRSSVVATGLCPPLGYCE